MLKKQCYFSQGGVIWKRVELDLVWSGGVFFLCSALCRPRTKQPSTVLVTIPICLSRGCTGVSILQLPSAW